MIELTIKKVSEEKCEGKVAVEGKGIDLVEEASSGIVEILNALKSLDEELYLATVMMIVTNLRKASDDSVEKERCN